MKKRIDFAVNEQGLPIGEAHHNAKLSDAQVEIIRDLYEEGFVSYRSLALTFGVSREAIADICKYRRRACTPVAYKSRTIEVDANFAVRPQLSWEGLV